MTERQTIVLEKLKAAGSATTAELVEWCGCERKDALLTLGIMIRVEQIFRVGWNKSDGVHNGVALWGLDRPGTNELPYNKELRTGHEQIRHMG